MKPSADSSPPLRTKHRLWGLIMVFACAVVFAAVVHQGDDGPKSGRPSSPGSNGQVAITTATAKKGNIGVYLDAIGTVTPVYTSSITAQANGILTAVNYAEGQVVKKGDPLIEIDPRPYQAQLVEAQGTLEHDTNLLAQAQMDPGAIPRSLGAQRDPETNPGRPGKTRAPTPRHGNAQVAQMTASVQLIAALGGGWDQSQLPTPAQVAQKPAKAESAIQQ